MEFAGNTSLQHRLVIKNRVPIQRLIFCLRTIHKMLYLSTLEACLENNYVDNEDKNFMSFENTKFVPATKGFMAKLITKQIVDL